MSQTLAQGAGWTVPTPVSPFVNLWETETDCEQSVLLTHRPAAREAEALTQPQHGFEALDGPPRRVEGLEAANPRHGPLDPEVIALDPLLQVLRHIVDWRARQQAGFPALRDRGWVGPRTIGPDPVGGEQRLVFQRLAEEALGGLQVALRREQEVDRGAVLVDGAVQIAPLAADLDVCLIDADRAAMGFAEGAQPTFDQGRVGQHPPVQSAVINLQAALPEQLFDVAVAEWVAQIPGDGLQDQRCLEVAALEVVFGPALQLLDKGVQDHVPPPVRRRLCGPHAQRGVNAKTLRQPQVMTLDAGEFMRRFLLHTLPSGFQRIRYYGLFANGHRADRLRLCRQVLEAVPSLSDADPGRDRDEPRSAPDPHACPCCGGWMVVIETFSG